MRFLSALSCLALVMGCANGQVVDDDSGAPPEDVHVNEVVTLPEAGGDAKDASIDVFDAGCTPDAALGGIGLPAGTTATATTSYDVNTPDLAVDGNLGTYWNAGDLTGSLTITFSSAQTFDAVRIRATALPTSDETYTLTGYQDAVQVQIGQSTQSVAQGSSVLAPIAVTAATYDAIRIDVTSTQSWVAITEVGLVTPSCP